MQYLANENRYNKMQYRRCGKSGLLLPVVSLGLWHNFGSINSYENSKGMVLGSFDLGITHFDLANNYGPAPGSAESTFGKIINEELKPYRDEIVVSSKAGYFMWEGPYGEWGSKKNLIASIDQSLKRLQLDYVDIFYHHRPDPNTPIEETVEALEQIVRSGKALYVGISNYSVEQTEEITKLLLDRKIHCLVHQMKYSMIEKGNLDVVENLDKWGMGGVAFSPLAQGILSGKYINGIPEDSRAKGTSQFLNENNITNDVTEITKKLTKIADNRNQSLSQMALAWVLNYENMTSVIIGASKYSQIEENVNSINNLTFTSDEIKAINEILV